MDKEELSAIYRGYIDCLNRQDWDNLGRFVADNARHNGNPLGLSGYRAMLEGDSRAIPDLRFKIALLVSDPPMIASRLEFDRTPVGSSSATRSTASGSGLRGMSSTNSPTAGSKMSVQHRQGGHRGADLKAALGLPPPRISLSNNPHKPSRIVLGVPPCRPARSSSSCSSFSAHALMPSGHGRNDSGAHGFSPPNCPSISAPSSKNRSRSSAASRPTCAGSSKARSPSSSTR